MRCRHGVKAWILLTAFGRKPAALPASRLRRSRSTKLKRSISPQRLPRQQVSNAISRANGLPLARLFGAYQAFRLAQHPAGVANPNPTATASSPVAPSQTGRYLQQPALPTHRTRQQEHRRRRARASSPPSPGSRDAIRATARSPWRRCPPCFAASSRRRAGR